MGFGDIHGPKPYKFIGFGHRGGYKGSWAVIARDVGVPGAAAGPGLTHDPGPGYSQEGVCATPVSPGPQTLSIYRVW
jgi:hypothetical protein